MDQKGKNTKSFRTCASHIWSWRVQPLSLCHFVKSAGCQSWRRVLGNWWLAPVWRGSDRVQSSTIHTNSLNDVNTNWSCLKLFNETEAKKLRRWMNPACLQRSCAQNLKAFGTQSWFLKAKQTLESKRKERLSFGGYESVCKILSYSEPF